MGVDRQARERRLQPPSAQARERTHVRAEVDLVGPDVPRHRRQLALGRAMADRQASAALPQRRVEVAQAIEQELGARAGAVTPVQQAIVQAEDGHHPLVAIECSP
jgi:hypothetical protein